MDLPFERLNDFAPSHALYETAGMDTSPKALALLAVDSTLDIAISQWEKADYDTLLATGDKLGEIEEHLQLYLGARLTVFEDELGYCSHLTSPNPGHTHPHHALCLAPLYNALRCSDTQFQQFLE